MASVVYDMAGKMVENLRCVADQSPGRLPRRVANELRKLADETSSIRQVLVDAEKKQAHDDKVRDWLAEVEDVLHDVENMVDELRFQVSRCGSRKPIITMREECKCFSICSDRLVFCRDIISDRRIKKCARELHRLGESRRLLDLEERLEEAAFGGLWKTISSSPRKSLNIGRESEKERILRYLLFSGDDQEGVPVLPIVGVGGFGKTMLAQLVYDDDMVRNHFDLRTWVHVSDSFDFTLLLRKLIQSANDSIAHMSSENVGDDSESMIVYFHSEILERRFLLVLDDMTMNENCTWGWEQFKGHLSSDAAKRAGSRIIVTTRDPAVARMTGTIESCELSGLNEDLSWSIFESFFPVGVRQMPSNVPVSEVGKKIVNKCGGNPFVIQAISGMLLFRDPETQWHVMEKDLSDIFQDGKDILSKTVELSYDDLPSNLKKCFGYCSLFPKDYEIDVQTLIKLWTSEGFIKLEEEGYECFLNLLWRSFFEESKRDEEEDKVTKCKMQNLLHDHAKSLFRNRCITFGSDFEGVVDVRRARHVSFDLHLDSLWQIPSSLIEAKGIRTVILPSQLQWETDGRSEESICGVMVSEFNCLRTLDLHNSGIKVVPDSISELKFLRYLDLSQNKDIKVLPKSFTKLQYLQTLKLNHCGRLRELPGDIEKLANLRNLEITSCYSLTHMPRGLGKLTHLQILSEFVSSTEHTITSAGGLDELKTLNNLRGNLRVKNMRPGEDTKAANLSEKQFLQSLMLMWEIDAADPVHYEKSLEDLQPHSYLRELSLSAYGGFKFPSWLSSHTSLVKFFLWRCPKCTHLPRLNHLPRLKVLVLEEMADLEYISEEEPSAPVLFLSLKELRLSNLNRLRGWWRRRVFNDVEGSVKFPRLSKLIIENCSSLDLSMPRFPDVELLVLKSTKWEPLERTVDTSSSSPLSQLKTCCLVNMSGDYYGLDVFPFFRSHCALPSLRSLTLDHISNIDGIIECFQHVTDLQELNIWRCGRLKEIPTWIRDLKSLRKLSIRLCPNLTIPPDQMISLFASIQKVEIEDCLQIAYMENLLKDRIFMRR